MNQGVSILNTIYVYTVYMFFAIVAIYMDKDY